MARIEVLETSLGRQRNFDKYFTRTVAATSILGATILGIQCIGAYVPCDYIYLGFAAGAIYGLPLGVLIGSVVKEERWNPVALSAPAASG